MAKTPPKKRKGIRNVNKFLFNTNEKGYTDLRSKFYKYQQNEKFDRTKRITKNNSPQVGCLTGSKRCDANYIVPHIDGASTWTELQEKYGIIASNKEANVDGNSSVDSWEIYNALVAAGGATSIYKSVGLGHDTNAYSDAVDKRTDELIADKFPDLTQEEINGMPGNEYHEYLYQQGTAEKKAREQAKKEIGADPKFSQLNSKMIMELDLPIGALIGTGNNFKDNPGREIGEANHSIEVAGYDYDGMPMVYDYGNLQRLDSSMYSLSDIKDIIVKNDGAEQYRYKDIKRQYDDEGWAYEPLDLNVDDLLTKADKYLKDNEKSSGVKDALGSAALGLVSPLASTVKSIYDNRGAIPKFLGITSSGVSKDARKNAEMYAKTLSKNKEKYMEKLNISSKEYDELARESVGILLQESGTTTERGLALDRSVGKSVGSTQINAENLAEYLNPNSEKYNEYLASTLDSKMYVHLNGDYINNGSGDPTEDFLMNPENSAFTTMAMLKANRSFSKSNLNKNTQKGTKIVPLVNNPLGKKVLSALPKLQEFNYLLGKEVETQGNNTAISRAKTDVYAWNIPSALTNSDAAGDNIGAKKVDAFTQVLEGKGGSIQEIMDAQSALEAEGNITAQAMRIRENTENGVKPERRFIPGISSFKFGGPAGFKTKLINPYTEMATNSFEVGGGAITNGIGLTNTFDYGSMHLPSVGAGTTGVGATQGAASNLPFIGEALAIAGGVGSALDPKDVNGVSKSINHGNTVNFNTNGVSMAAFDHSVNYSASNGKDELEGQQRGQTFKNAVDSVPILGDLTKFAGGVSDFLFGWMNPDKPKVDRSAIAEQFNGIVSNEYEGINSNAVGSAFNSSREYPMGGALPPAPTGGIETIDIPMTHENNQFGGVKISEGPNGKPNLAKNGEKIYRNFVFTDEF